MRRDPAKAIAVLDAMLEFFDGGKRWMRGMMHDPSSEHRCLIGALQHIRAEFGFRGDRTLDLLDRALPDERKKQTPIGSSIPKTLRSYYRLMYFNDGRAASYDEVRALIIEARTIAEAERDAAGDRRRTRALIQPDRSVTARCDSAEEETL